MIFRKWGGGEGSKPFVNFRKFICFGNSKLPLNGCVKKIFNRGKKIRREKLSQYTRKAKYKIEGLSVCLKQSSCRFWSDKGKRISALSNKLSSQSRPWGKFDPIHFHISILKWAHAVKYDQVKYCKHFRAIISKTSVTDAVFAEKTIPQMRFLQVLS